MGIIGTIQRADGGTDHVTVPADTYDNAKAALEAAIPDGTKLIAIRTDS